MRSPARIACNIDHGREDPGDAVGTRLLSGNARDSFGRFGIPACRHGQRHGKRGAVAVDDVEPKENGNVQARLFHRDVLIAVGFLGSHHVEHGTDLSLGDQFVVGQV